MMCMGGVVSVCVLGSGLVSATTLTDGTATISGGEQGDVSHHDEYDDDSVVGTGAGDEV